MNTEHPSMWRQALGIVAIFVIVAAGFCCLGSDDQNHGAASLGLCLSMIAAALGALVLVVLPDVGRPCIVRRWIATPVTIAVLDPPPWSYLSA